MSSNKRTYDGNDSKQPAYADESQICMQCKGRRFILVATSKPNETSTIYERQECQACAEEPYLHDIEKDDQLPHSENKTMLGTGYLRNKKRRRKAATE